MIFSNFFSRHRKLIFLVLLFILPGVPLFLLRIELPRINAYDWFYSRVVLPVAEGTQNAYHGVSYIWNNYMALANAARENSKLKEETLELRNEISKLNEFQIENERLRELLSVPALPNAKRLVAKVIGPDASSETLSFFVNVGSVHGIKSHMAVINASGAVGTISRVYHNSALVLSLLDPAHDVDGIVIRSRARMIVEGKGKPLLGRLKYLDRAEDVRVGDEVLTSGMDGIFPKGLRIGNVIKVNRPQSGVLQEAEVRSSADIGNLEEVIVLLDPPALENGDEHISSGRAR